MSSATSGSSATIVDADLSYNPNTNVLTAGGFSGDGSGLTGITASQVGAMANVESDTDPDLGGDLDLNGFDIIGTGNVNITGVITATSFDGTLATSDLSGTITNAQLANSSVSYGGVELSLGGSDATPAFDLSDATDYPYSSLVGAPTIPSATSDLTNDSGFITSVSFDNLTDKTSGTGEYSTNGNIVSGRGSGGAALTINDGFGNANVTFNHANGTPEQNGRAGRIEVNTDSTSGDAYMYFELGNATASTAAALTSILTLSSGTSIFTSSAGLTFNNIPAFNGGTSNSTSPFTVDSTQVVTNLNADLLDGQHGSYYLDYTNFTGTPTIPSATSDLTNDSGFITSSSSITGNAASADTVDVTLTGTSASYNVLFATGGSNQTVRYDGGITYNPNSNLFTVTNGTIQAGGTSTFSGNGSNLTNIPYSSLTNTPTIPTNNNQLTNGAGYITSFDITTQTDPKYLRSNAADTAAGSITFTANPKLNDNVRINFGTSSSISLRRDTTNLIMDIPNSGTFFIRDTSGTASIKHSFAVNGNYTAQGTITGNLFSGSGASLTNIPYSSLTGTPTIPSATSDLTNDSGFITSSDDITGNAATSDEVSITTDTNNNTTYVAFVANLTDTHLPLKRNSSLTYNAGTGRLNATKFGGDGSTLTNLNASNISSGTIDDARLPNSISSNITGNAATVSVTSITSGATERPVYFNDGTTTSGNGVLRMDGSANGMRYRADQNRLLLSNLTVVNAVTGDLNGNADTATLASNVDVSSITSGATERRVYFNDGTTTSGSGVVRMDGSANGMRYRADQNRLLLSNLTVTNAVVGDLNGTATNATNVNLRTRNGTDATHFVTFGTSGSGNQRLNTDTGLTYNPSSNTLTASTFSGNLSGNAATASHWISPITLTLSGDVTGSGTFNGQTDITFSVTVNNDSHTHDTRYVRLTTNQTISGTKTFSDTISGNINGSSASCTGNAVTASTATQVVNNDGSALTDTSCYIPFTRNLNSPADLYTESSLSYNSNNGRLFATSFSGDGSNLTSLPAGQLTGTISDARLPGTISSNITGSSASCTGNAASADTVDVTLTGTNASYNVLFATGGSNQTVRYDGGITYNPNNNLFTVTNGTIQAGGTSTFSGNGSNLTSLPAGQLTGTIDDARLPATISSDITGTSAGCEVSTILSLLSTGQAIQIRGNPSSNLSRVYRFGKPNANSTEVFFNLNNITADRTFTWPNAGGTVATTTSSDRRLKTNVSNITSQSALDFVNNVSPVTFDWKTDIHNGQSHAHSQSAGYIAQQVISAGYSYMLDTTPMEEDFVEKELYFNHDTSEIDTETGVNNPEDAYYTMNYEMATPFLHKALADALTKIDELQARIVALESN